MVDPKVGAGASEQALLDYFDDLLGDETPVLDLAPPVPAPARTPPVRKPAEARAALPFAEPARTFTLRMPLPEVAAPVVEAPVATAPPERELEIPFSRPLEEPIGKAATTDITPNTSEPDIAVSRPAEVVAPKVESAPELTPAPLENAGETQPENTAADAPEYQPKPWLANGRPEWAQEPFECLLFRVGGLAMAVPLVELGTIYPLAEHSMTPIFGQASWFMGLLSIKHESVRVIDSAQVVMPERYEASMREGYRYVITLDGSDWGLAVDTVINAVRLEPGQVRWRGARSQRPWLAGTVVAQMCALIDGSQLTALFDRQDRKRRAAMRRRPL